MLSYNNYFFSSQTKQIPAPSPSPTSIDALFAFFLHVTCTLRQVSWTAPNSHNINQGGILNCWYECCFSGSYTQQKWWRKYCRPSVSRRYTHSNYFNIDASLPVISAWFITSLYNAAATFLWNFGSTWHDVFKKVSKYILFVQTNFIFHSTFLIAKSLWKLQALT